MNRHSSTQHKTAALTDHWKIVLGWVVRQRLSPVLSTEHSKGHCTPSAHCSPHAWPPHCTPPTASMKLEDSSLTGQKSTCHADWDITENDPGSSYTPFYTQRVLNERYKAQALYKVEGIRQALGPSRAIEEGSQNVNDGECSKKPHPFRSNAKSPMPAKIHPPTTSPTDNEIDLGGRRLFMHACRGTLFSTKQICLGQGLGGIKTKVVSSTIRERKQWLLRVYCCHSWRGFCLGSSAQAAYLYDENQHGSKPLQSPAEISILISSPTWS